MIKIIRQKISKEEIHKFLGHPFSDMIKFVVDIKREIVALGGELHADAEEILLRDGSKQKDLWGGNFYPNQPKNIQIEYTALINIRPSHGNNSMEIKDRKIRNELVKVLDKLLP